MQIEAMKRVHLMGVGGAGMSGLALLLKELGLDVSGCDMVRTFYVEKLLQHGIEFVAGHHKDHLSTFKPDLLIYTSAISQDHPEIQEARERGIRVARRAEVLSLLFNHRSGIGVAGTHGKTTTSSMISLIAEQARMDPTVALGGELCDIGCNAKIGHGQYMVAELDESDGSFELFNSEIAVVTNIDWDHVDHYPTLECVVGAFDRFLHNLKPNGLAVVCGEDKGTSRLLSEHHYPRLETYGWGNSWDWGAVNVTHLQGGGVVYTVLHEGNEMGDVKLRVSGEHNVLNSLAACAVAFSIGIPFDVTARALSGFRGAKRRLQYIGGNEDVDIYDDYGHHPREIRATLETVRKIFPSRRIVVVFQPHRYTRTAAMYREFAEVLSIADEVFLLPIYGADEKPMDGVDSKLIFNSFSSRGIPRCTLCATFAEAEERLLGNLRKGDLLLTVGAGNVCSIGKKLADKIGKRETSTKDALVISA